MNEPSNTSPQQTQPPKKVSHKASITGFILAVVSLLFAGIAKLVINAEYTPTGPTEGTVEREVGHAIATGTTSILGAIFGVPFLVGAIVLAIASFIFIVLRLRKVRIGGLVFSIIAVLILVWSMSITFEAFDVIKADPVSNT